MGGDGGKGGPLGGDGGGGGENMQVSPSRPQPLLGRAGSGHWKTLESAALVMVDCALVRAHVIPRNRSSSVGMAPVREFSNRELRGVARGGLGGEAGPLVWGRGREP